MCRPGKEGEWSISCGFRGQLVVNYLKWSFKKLQYNGKQQFHYTASCIRMLHDKRMDCCVVVNEGATCDRWNSSSFEIKGIWRLMNRVDQANRNDSSAFYIICEFNWYASLLLSQIRKWTAIKCVFFFLDLGKFYIQFDCILKLYTGKKFSFFFGFGKVKWINDR